MDLKSVMPLFTTANGFENSTSVFLQNCSHVLSCFSSMKKEVSYTGNKPVCPVHFVAEWCEREKDWNVKVLLLCFAKCCFSCFSCFTFICCVRRVTHRRQISVHFWQSHPKSYLCADRFLSLKLFFLPFLYFGTYSVLVLLQKPKLSSGVQ